jgi:hypothetical protein
LLQHLHLPTSLYTALADNSVAYLRLADNVLGPPPFRLRRVNQPVVRSQISFSASR